MTSHDDTTAPPRRFIFTEADLQHFIDSATYTSLLQTVQACGQSIVAHPDYDPNHALSGLTPCWAVLHGALTHMHATWLLDLPPSTNVERRFGNPTFKAWHERLVERSVSIVSCMLSYARNDNAASSRDDNDEYDHATLAAAHQAGMQAAQTIKSMDDIDTHADQVIVVELCHYLTASFGHPVRLDYGTGHESSWQIFLHCWLQIPGAYHNNNDDAGRGRCPPLLPPSPSRLAAVTLSLWHAYLRVCRQVQTDYMLEPAGSHGVWGLDDYHCLPFFYGASQLVRSATTEPGDIHDTTVLAAHGDTHLYFGCIRYITTLKQGVPFGEHSPMLHDISALATWNKVAAGLLKLYVGEVLHKRVVVQHWTFKNLFVATWTPSQANVPTAPTETFRSSGRGGGNNTSGSRLPPPTKAPWAK